MYIVFFITFAVLILLWMTVRGRAAQIKDLRSAEEAIVAVDVDSFRNLIDVQQDRYLREHLRPRDFRLVQRSRYLAIAEYLRRVAANTSVMLRLGEAARNNHEPSVAAQGAELASAAVSVRMLCLMALLQAYAGAAFPGAGLSVGSVVDSYDSLTVKLWSIGRAWAPLQNVS